MKLYEHWTYQYRANPYLDHISDNHLIQRARDIFANITTLSNDAKIGVVQVDEHGKNWWILWTHILEEMRSRFGPYPNSVWKEFAKEVHYPDPRNEISKKAAEFVRKYEVNGQRYLYKYGKSKYLNDLLNYGILRLAPASSYSDPSLNLSIRDNELQIKIYPNPHTFAFESDRRIIKNKDYKSKPHLKKISINSNTDYYVFCMSSILLPRLFNDFNVDSCLLIKNPTLFLNKLNASFRDSVKDFQTVFSSVKYYDPILINSTDLNPFTSKHFKYTYEKEVRFICIPKTKMEKLDYKIIELGNLSEIAEILII